MNLGHIQKIGISEQENIEKLSSMNSGHLSALIEDGLYWANVSIETKLTKASMPVILKMCMGTVAEATDYTATSSLVRNSYSLKVSYLANKVALINGLVVKDFQITAAKGEMLAITMNCIAAKVTKSTEELSVSTNIDKPFSWLDCKATIGGNAHVLNSFNISGNWNITDDEGRGIEAVASGSRRLINNVIKHRFDVNGSYEAEVSDNLEFGYADERVDEAIVFTVERGTDNEHVFTLSKTRSNAKNYEATIENSKRIVSCDFEALDLGVTGDL